MTLLAVRNRHLYAVAVAAVAVEVRKNRYYDLLLPDVDAGSMTLGWMTSARVLADRQIQPRVRRHRSRSSTTMPPVSRCLLDEMQEIATKPQRLALDRRCPLPPGRQDVKRALA